MEILKQGGNAFDAAVAVSAALAVVEPSSSGLGGGGFWLLHRASDGFETMVDAREVAPRAATRDMFLDEKGNVVPGRSTATALAAGIPGEPAGFAHLANEVRPAAAQDRACSPRFVWRAKDFRSTRVCAAASKPSAIRSAPAPPRRCFCAKGEVPAVGTIIRQPELAQTLTRAGRAAAPDGFYKGAGREAAGRRRAQARRHLVAGGPRRVSR